MNNFEILHGDVREMLAGMAEKSVPPYGNLRDYETGTWEDEKTVGRRSA